MANFYVAYKLDDASREKLLGIFKPKYSDVIAHHVTHKYGAGPEDVPPPPEKVRIVGYHDSGAIQVLVVDVDGNVIHSWRIDWFELWPDPTHLSADLLPKTNPGPVHGVVIAPNGDLILNFERLGMARLDACGKVKWKLPRRTHHSIHLDERGNIWTSGLITRHEPRSNLPNYAPPFEDYTIVKVSPTGELLEEFSIADVLVDNGLRGLLYLSTSANRSTRVTGDTLHVNDIELFPQSMAPGAFSAGDILVSLRNINTILVLDPTVRHVKFVSVGAVIRQHDPDFVDGNTISVFDNNNLGAAAAGENPDPTGQYSRIVRLSATTRDIQVRFSGSDEHPFFTDIMGDHQLLPNGNMLLNESVAGRVIEVTARGDVIWEYVNLVGNGLAGLISDADVLPPGFDSAFFARTAAACSARPQN